jgi:DNA mismatch repair protein MutH
MKLIEAQKRIEKLAYIPFKEYLTEEQFNNIVVNKGKTGQILELTIGLQLSNTTLDFEDGELKTNKCNKLGIPAETMFITQTASIIDELLSFKLFEESKLYKKINRMLYVRINKEGAPENWMFLPPILVDLSLPKYAELAAQLKFDYIDICEILNDQLCLSPDAMLHTANGKYIQIRTKDSIPYHTIYSRKYDRIVSDKNRAFYFKIPCLKYLITLE